MKRYSKEERELAVELWEDSGLSRSKFCEQEGIAKTTFQEWTKRYGSQSVNNSVKEQKGSSGFVSVKMSSLVSSVQSTNESLTLHYPNGVKLTGLEGLSKPELLLLIGME